MGFLSTSGSFVLFLPQSLRVLNCGDLDGTTSITLSTCSKSVVSVCPDIATAVLVQRQIIDHQITNILVVVGSEVDLPFPEKTFSLIVHHFFSFKGLSVRVGIGNIIKKKREYLRMIERDGTVYVAFETHENLLKGLLQKIGIFSALIGIFLSRKWSLLANVFHYESFEELYFIRCFSPGNLLHPEVLFFFLKRCIAGSNIGFVFSGSPMEHESLLLVKRIKEKILSETGEDPGRVICYRIGSGGSVIAEFSEYIVRVSLQAKASVYAAKNYKALELLATMNFPFVVPKAVTTGSVAGFNYYCETKLAGVSLDLDRLSGVKEERIQEMAVHSISSPSMQICEAESTALNKLLDSPFTELKQFVAEDKKVLFEKALQHIHKLLLHEHLPLVIVHGDFKKSNFLVQSSKPEQDVGLIDWECMEIPGFPLIDLLRFFNYDVYGWEEDNVDIIPNVWEMVQQHEYPPAVLTYCEALKIPLHLLPTLYLVFLVWYLLAYCREDIQLDDEYRHDVLATKFLKVLKEYIVMANIE